MGRSGRSLPLHLYGTTNATNAAVTVGEWPDMKMRLIDRIVRWMKRTHIRNLIRHGEKRVQEALDAEDLYTARTLQECITRMKERLNGL